LKVISYNVNGIRAAQRNGLMQWLKAAAPDILCLQEVKATEAQFETEAFAQLGYHHYWFAAQKPGYSGVAILSKRSPDHVVRGMGMSIYDDEARLIRADFDDLTIISVYHPSGSNPARIAFKLQWMEDFTLYIERLRVERPNLIICGDFNICHTAIDIHDPIRLQHVSGFLPVEREWMTRFLNTGLIDTFRHFNSESQHYTWWSYMGRARLRNKGWRIDYIIVSDSLETRLIRAAVLAQAHHSDHCPVMVEMR